MIKKLLVSLLCIIPGLNAYAIHSDFNIYLFRKHFAEEYIEAVAQAYRDALLSTRPTTKSDMAEKFWIICRAGGLDINTVKGRTLCAQFEEDWLNAQYYRVCKDDKGQTGKTEHCVTLFDNVEVQYGQAKNLAVEYAKVYYQDDIICNSKDVQTERRDDYISCTSVKDFKTYYEFKFDDAFEVTRLENKYINREFGRGLCEIYGGKPEDVVDISRKILRERVWGPRDYTFHCKNINCSYLSQKIRKWGFDVTDNSGECKVLYDEFLTGNSQAILSKDYYGLFDGFKFTVYYKNKPYLSWDAVSGRGKTPTDEHRTICQRPKYQACKNVGPTPAGRYYINQNEVERLDNFVCKNYESCTNFNAEAQQRASYGPSRVLLRPYFQNQTYSRDQMYIHGGDYAGSAGCIDLVKNINEFMDWFENQPEFTTMEIWVDYELVEDVVSGNDCIKSENVETQCLYDTNPHGYTE